MLAKYPHEESITKFLPSVIPPLFFAFCTWIAKRITFKLIDDDKENEVSHNNENQQNNNNENQEKNNNENLHETEFVNPSEDNENIHLVSGYQSTGIRRTNGSVNSNV